MIDITITAEFDNTNQIGDRRLSIKTSMKPEDLPDRLIPLLTCLANLQNIIKTLNQTKNR